MENKIPSYLLQTEAPTSETMTGKKLKLSFLDKTLLSSAKTIKSIYTQSEQADKDNWLCRINPKVKLLSLIYLIVVISLVHNVVAQLMLSVFILLLFVLSGINALSVYKKIFLLAFVFGFLIIFPASLNVITPGKIILRLIEFEKPSQFWIYHIPQNIGFTKEGIEVVMLVFLRVLNSVSLSLLIVFTTSFPGFVKSFKLLGVPDAFLMIITLAYKYIFVLSHTIEETYQAIKSRLIVNLKNKNIKNVVSGRVFFIFRRAGSHYEHTYNAMVSRGYTGKILLHSKKRFGVADAVALAVITVLGIVILFI